MSKQEFSSAPHYDDFDPSKGYHGVLFRPGRAIQTRELNQLQTIQNHQLEGYGSHLFKFGSMVKIGSVKYQISSYVRLKDSTPSGSDVSISLFTPGRKVKGVTSKISAMIQHATPKDEYDPATLFVSYTSSAKDGETATFVNGENIELYDENGYVIYTTTVRCPDCTTNADADTIDPVGNGTIFAVEPASYFVYGRIVDVSYQVIALDKYDTRPSYKIGFDIVQNIVTSQDDESLLDNAAGSPNYTAPGADRYQIMLNLVHKPLEYGDDENFVMLARVEAGVVQTINDKPQYSDIMKMIARRTYDESGDYTVNAFKVKFRPHLLEDNNGGWKTEDEGGDPEKFVVDVSPGKAYVRGFEIERIAWSALEADRARETEGKRSAVIRATHGNYILVTLTAESNLLPVADMSGTGAFASDFNKVSFYDGPCSGGNFTGNQIGTARVKGIELHKGTPGVDAVYKLFLFSVVMGQFKTIADVQGVFRSGGGDQTFVANIVEDVDAEVNKIYSPIDNNLLFKIPYNYVASVRDVDNPLVPSTTITAMKKYIGAVNSSQEVVFAAEGTETFLSYNPYRWMVGLQASASGNYAPIDVSTTNGRMSISTSEIILSGFSAGDIGKNVVLTCEVSRAAAKEKKKTLVTEVLSNLDGHTNTLSLQHVDAFEVIEVLDVTDPADQVDVTDNYLLKKNIFDNYYGISELVLKSGIDVPGSGTLIKATFKRFAHSSDGNYFSVDSYSSIVNDPDSGFTYDDIPNYVSNDGVSFAMSDVLDFRPSIGTDGTFGGAETILSNIPVNESTMVFDVEYYAPRIDLLCLDDEGLMFIVKGTPTLEPNVPATPSSAMALYQLYINAWTSNPKVDVRTKYIDNKRYTMRDIGRLETRISTLERYVSLSLLEQDTSSLDVVDSNGNSRFKNGFMVDDFKDFTACDLSSSEFSTAYDTRAGELRPSFMARSVHLALNDADSTHFVRSGKTAHLPYSNVLYQEQPYASKTISINPYFIYNKTGTVALSPSSDWWKDSNIEPDVVVGIDTGYEALSNLANAAGILGTVWSDWEDVGGITTLGGTTVTNKSGNTTDVSAFSNRNDTSSALTTTNVTEFDIDSTRTTTTSYGIQEQTRTQSVNTLSSELNQYNLGYNVTDVNLIAYCRSIPIAFAAQGMKANTKVYAFFDGVDVTEDCRLLNKSSSDGLYTDANGGIAGIFVLPNSDEKRFFVGDRIFRLTNSATNSTDPDELTTSAECTFHAGGLEVTGNSTILSVETPIFTSTATNVTDTQYVLGVSGTSTRTQIDPLAQTFTVSEATGVFLTSLEVFFEAKDDEVPVWAEIRNVVNGYPGPVVVPFTHVELRPSDVSISEDGSVATTFNFTAPAYLNSGEDYCFVIGSNSPDYRIFVARLGGTAIGKDAGSTISTQTHGGSLFKSQNNKTWNAEQYEDIKFKMTRADFDISAEMKLFFNNTEDHLLLPMDTNPFETETGSNRVRVYMKNHSLNIGDKIKINPLQDTWYKIYLSNGNLVVGQQLIGGTNGGTAIIKGLRHPGNDGLGHNVYEVQLGQLTGFFADGETFSAPVYYEAFDPSTFTTAMNVTPYSLTHNVGVGTFPTGVDNDFNGIPLSEISGPTHQVIHVDSLDSFIIQTVTAATIYGRTGGTGVYAVTNIPMDAYKMILDVIDHDGTQSWEMSTVKRKTVGSNTNNYEALPTFSLIPNTNGTLPYSCQIATEVNEAMYLGDKSLKLKGRLQSGTTWLSPVVNLETIAIIAIGNRIEWNTCENYSVAPLADTSGNPVICDETDPAYTGTARWKKEETYNGGSEGCKYIMKPALLDTSATNLTLILDVFKSLDSDVEVYYRTLPVESDESIQTQPWVYAPFETDPVSSKSTQFIETTISLPSDPTATLPEFKAYQMKLVLRSKNPANPPKVQKCRAIAIT